MSEEPTSVLAPPVDPAPPPGRPLRAFPGLDAVRALGATTVLATHAAFQTGRSVHGAFSGTLARFDIGVALFFVLSGFLLFRPFAQAAVSGTGRWPRTADYLWRRALRILPAYWLAVAACLLLLPANAGQRGAHVWLRYLTLTQVYSGGLQRVGLTQMWSLCAEVAFYLLLPVLAALVLRRGGATGPRALTVLGGLAAVSVVWVLVTSGTTWLPATAGQWLPAYLDWFCCGMTLALVQVRLTSRAGRPDGWMRALEEVARSTWTCWGAALALFAVATTPVAGPRGFEAVPTSWEAVVKNLLYAACAVFVVLPLALGPQNEGGAARALGVRPVRLLGEISYGIFLWHKLVLEEVVRALHQPLFTGSWLSLFTRTWLASVVVAAVCYVVVERPALRLKDRRFGRGRRVGSSADQTRTSAARQSA